MTTLEQRDTDVIEVPIIYPLVSLKLATVAMVGEKPVQMECEELLNFNELFAVPSDNLYTSAIRLLSEFREYVQKVTEAASTPQALAAYQNILDTQAPSASPSPEEPPLLPEPQAVPDQRTEPVAPPAPLPDTASL